MFDLCEPLCLLCSAFCDVFLQGCTDASYCKSSCQSKQFGIIGFTINAFSARRPKTTGAAGLLSYRESVFCHFHCLTVL